MDWSVGVWLLCSGHLGFFPLGYGGASDATVLYGAVRPGLAGFCSGGAWRAKARFGFSLVWYVLVGWIPAGPSGQRLPTV
jgi:hypothetical protein